ncbi:MAG: sulfatase-like hydrolase/transferase [Anaerolineae bacterium]|nr:sulfatase-like hydrolase/transferase [Anaerolineae bacterium]
MPDPLSVILIQIDSLNRHFLPCYGNDWVETANLDAFAERAAVFENHYASSMPCMPARREIWTGTQEFWWRPWGPLEPWDMPIAYLAGRAGITSQLITDHYHFFEWGSHNYTYDYTGYEFIRGHETDNWRTEPVVRVPDWAQKMVERRDEAARIYLRNVQHFKKEDDFFGPRVMRAVGEWLDRNWAHAQFFLHVDCFDVHEPFHIPEPYRSRYTDADYRRFSPWPHYGRIDEGASALSPEEVAWVRAQYAGKLAMLDTWLARVFDRLDRYSLWDRTCVIITTDHGHYLGDHGWMGKPHAPLYHTLAHIPLLVWHPAGAHNGARVPAITQTLDLYATVLDLLGVGAPQRPYIHSRSFAPVLTGEAERHRDCAVYGYAGQRVGVTTDQWTLLREHDPQAAPAHAYTHQVEHLAGFGWPRRRERALTFPDLEAGRFIPGVDMPVWRMPAHSGGLPRADLLFHNPTDPGQERNMAPTQPVVVKQLEGILREHARALAVPEEQLRRLRLI